MKIWNKFLCCIKSALGFKKKPAYKFLSKTTGSLVKKGSTPTNCITDDNTVSIHHNYYLKVKVLHLGILRIDCDRVVWNLVKKDDKIPIIYSGNILHRSAYLDLQEFNLVER